MNLLILAIALASCLVFVSCLPSTDQVALIETDPIQHVKSDTVFASNTSSGPQVELKITRISISGQWVKMDVINRTGVALSSIKGQITYLDSLGNVVHDSLQMRDFHPFSAYKMQGLVGPNSRSSIVVETIVPAGCKDARVALRQASHADGTVMEFKESVSWSQHH